MEAKGAGKLKVVGILFIIFGAICTIIYGLALVGGGVIWGLSGTVSSNLEQADMVQSGGTLLVTISSIYLVWSVIQLVTGILGVKNSKVPAKAKTLFILSIVLIVFSLVSNIVSIVFQGVSVTTIIGLVGGCVLPVIFMVGAKQNMNAQQ